jgi:hypothetical protein
MYYNFSIIEHILAKQRRLPVRKIEVHVEGELDKYVLMGKSSGCEQVCPGFAFIRGLMPI